MTDTERALRQKLIHDVATSFRSFGGGQTSSDNPIAAALKDSAPVFAAGVDIGDVVDFIVSALLAAVPQVPESRDATVNEQCPSLHCTFAKDHPGRHSWDLVREWEREWLEDQTLCYCSPANNPHHAVLSSDGTTWLCGWSGGRAMLEPER